MTKAGCAFILCLFAVLCGYGVVRAWNHGVAVGLGLAFGVVAWLAAVCGYAAALSIIDAADRREREGVPGWAIGLVWVLFLAMAPLSVWLFTLLR